MHRALEGPAPTATHRTHSIAFKRQVVQEFRTYETLHSLSRGHDPSRTLIRIWGDKHEAGVFDEDTEADSTTLRSGAAMLRPTLSIASM